MGMKKNIFGKKIIQYGRLKKTDIFNSPNSHFVLLQILALFLSLRWTPSQPYRLRQIDALCIKLFY